VKNPDGSGVDLFLEPAGYEFAQTFQKALFDNGVAATSFGCDDIDAEYETPQGPRHTVPDPADHDDGRDGYALRHVRGWLRQSASC
jgi:hypothetical protein